MNAQSQVTPVIRVENTDIPVTVYHDRRVITTELMAQVYGTAEKNIHDNFNNNKDRFEEGKHYFKLEGEALRNFKKSLTRNIRVSQQARHFILWTERGAARHAKMLDTDQAWDIFDKLEASYFEPTPKELPKPSIETFQVKILTVFTRGDEPTQQVVPYGSCIIDPDNIVQLKTFINEEIPVELMLDVINAASQKLARNLGRK